MENLLTNPSFDNGTDVATDWETEKTVTGNPVWSLINDGAGGKSQKVEYTGQAGDPAEERSLLEIFHLGVGNVAKGDKLRFSLDVKGTLTSCAAIVGLEGFDGATYLNEHDTAVTELSAEELTTYTSEYTVPEGCDGIAVYLQVNQITADSVVSLIMDNAVLEKIIPPHRDESGGRTNSAGRTNSSARANATGRQLLQ